MTDIEKLLKLAKEAPVNEQDGNNFNEAERFIMAFGIKQGHCVMRCAYLYRIYKQWTPKPATHRVFSQEFSTIFVSRKRFNKTIYMINQNLFELNVKLEKLKSV